MQRKRNQYDKRGSGAAAVEGVDWMLVGLYFVLAVIGWLMVYAADFDTKHPSLLDLSTTYGKQTLFGIVAFAVGGVILLIDSRMFKTFAYGFYGASVLLLILTVFIAPEIHGAHAWIPLFAGFNLQTGEIAKFATALTLACFLGGHDTTVRDYRTLGIAIGIIVLPMIIILLQNDTGSMLVFTSFFLMLYREGAPPWIYIIGIVFAALTVLTLMYSLEVIFMLLLLSTVAVLVFQIREDRTRLRQGLGVLAILSVVGMYFGLQVNDKQEYLRYWLVLVVLVIDIIALVAAGTVLYLNSKQQLVLFVTIGLLVGGVFTSLVNIAFYKVLQPHQQERIFVWLKPEKCDPRGPLYNVNQSKIAIGSGGFLGKGFLKGNVTKLNYVPEQVTDFIFCTVGEEQGFVGSIGLIVLYLLLLLRIIQVGERNRSKFTRIYAYCVAGILFLHFTINIGMTMGMLPVIGIPLPFLSYGGSSLISFTVLLAVLVRLDAAKGAQ